MTKRISQLISITFLALILAAALTTPAFADKGGGGHDGQNDPTVPTPVVVQTNDHPNNGNKPVTTEQSGTYEVYPGSYEVYSYTNTTHTVETPKETRVCTKAGGEYTYYDPGASTSGDWSSYNCYTYQDGSYETIVSHGSGSYAGTYGESTYRYTTNSHKSMNWWNGEKTTYYPQ